jgi:hypothetical protein
MGPAGPALPRVIILQLESSAMDNPFLGCLYPAKPKPGEEQVYTLLDHLTAEDIAYNVDRLRKLAKDAQHRADALEAYGERRRWAPPATARA